MMGGTTNHVSAALASRAPRQRGVLCVGGLCRSVHRRGVIAGKREEKAVADKAVLVTGGAGYIGSHACKALARAGYLPVAYDNLVYGHEAAVRWGPFVRADLADTERLLATMREHRIGAVMQFP